MAKITLYGMTKYSPKDKNLFDLVFFPAKIDRELAIKNIILQGGEYEVLYSDWDFLREQLGIISQKKFHTFEEWIRGLESTYNPIENYDRYEEYSDSTNTTGSNASNSNSVSRDTEGTTITKMGYNASNMTPTDGTNTNNNGETTTGTEGTSSSQTETLHNAHLHGNIGVTTAPAMLKEFYEISNWNLYDHIAHEFLKEIVIPIL